MFSSNRFRFVLSLVLMLALPALAGCSLINKLNARDELNKGVAAYSIQKWDVAEIHFQEAIRLDPELIAARLYMATAYRSQVIPSFSSPENLAMADRAIAAFQEVLDQEPGNVNAIANIAGIYNAVDEYDQAKAWYRRFAETDPENADPHYGIGTIDWKLAHDKTGLNGENAENLEEEDRAIVVGMVDEGVQSLQAALERKPDYHEAMQYLNLLYRERAYLAADDEEKIKWQREADRLALQALDLKRKQQEEEERRRHSFGAETETN